MIDRDLFDPVMDETDNEDKGDEAAEQPDEAAEQSDEAAEQSDEAAEQSDEDGESDVLELIHISSTLKVE